MSIPNATTHQLASQHRIEQRAANLLNSSGHLLESTIEMDALKAAANHLERTGLRLLVSVAAVVRAVHDQQDPHHPLDEAGEAAYAVAILVLGVDDPREPS